MWTNTGIRRVRNSMLQAVFVEEDDAVFAQRAAELRLVAFADHAHVLERDLLPLVESRLGSSVLETLGDRMQSFWDATVGSGPGAPERPHVYAAE